MIESKYMGLKLKFFGNKTPLQQGEVVLYHNPSLGFITSLSLPSYKIYFPLPLIWKLELCITNKRFLIVFSMFERVIQEFWAWFPSQKPLDDKEEILQFEAKSNKIGEFLEVTTIYQKRPLYWFCSNKIRLRFYTRDCKRIYMIMSSTNRNP